MAKDPDELLAEWRVILDRVRLDLQRVHLNRLLWQRVNAAMQQQAPATAPATWMNHYAQIYAQAQAMAIRRLVRASGAALSLGQLLDRLMQRPDVVTPERVRPETELVTGLMLVEERRWVNGRRPTVTSSTMRLKPSSSGSTPGSPTSIRPFRTSGSRSRRSTSRLITCQKSSKAMRSCSPGATSFFFPSSKTTGK